jgi:hypothetical protein
MPTKNKIIKQLNTVLLLRDTGAGGGNTTVGTATAAGATTIPVASLTNFAIGDTIRVGSGDTLELAVLTGVTTNLTTADPLTYAHAVGEPVVEQNAYDLGDVSEGGVTVTMAGGATQVPVSTRRLNFATLDGYLDMRAEFMLPTASLHNLAFATGTPLTEISGNGATVTPWAIVTDGTNFDTEINQSLVIIGTRMDGTTVRIELWNVDMDYTAYTMRLARGVNATTPFRAIASAGGVMTDNASAYVKNISVRPTKGKVFDFLQEVGIFMDETAGTPLSTTVGTQANNGQSTVLVVSGTGAAIGQWYRFGAIGSDQVEYHRLGNVVTTTFTLVDRLLRTMPIGTPVVQQKLVPLSGIDENGVTFAIGGTVEMLHSAVSRLAVGMKPGDAAPTVSLGLMDISLSNYAYAVGIPQSAIVGGRLPLNTNIGTTSIDGFYIRGLLQSGEQSWITCWGCEQDISNVGVALAARGRAIIPLTLRPASGVSFLQHT